MSSFSPTTPDLPGKVLPPNAASAARAAHLLAEGKLVIVPTETVYGVAFSLKSAPARALIRTLKTFPEKPGWVIHTGQLEECFAWLPGLSRLGRRMLTKALPGPIAFQVKLSEADLAVAQSRLGETWDETIIDGALTLRCPDSDVTRDLLTRMEKLGHPIAVIGAGGQAPAYELSDVADNIRAAVDLAIDDGSTRYRKPSTLVRIDGDKYKVLRAGVIDERIINRLADFTILFVCSGNTCRSPMAAAIAARLLADRQHIEPSELHARHLVVQSAGIQAVGGMRATREAVHAAKSLNAELGGHISQPVTTDLLRRADVIYTMTDAHREGILDQMPGAAVKTFRLDENADVEDPIGLSGDVYRQVAERLAQLINRRLDELAL